MNTTKKAARNAGWIYLILAITGIFSLMYVPSTIIVTGNASETASNIASFELLFRAGIFVGLVSSIVFVFLALALYRLLNDINHKQAVLMVTLVAISAAAGFSTTPLQLPALVALSGADFLSVFEKSQLEALAYLFLRSHSWALQGVQIFWGLWLFPFGFLVYKSGFIPRIFGILLIIAGCGYLLGSFSFFILPQYGDTLSTLVLLLEIGELPIIFWLLIVGATAPSEKKKG